MYQVLAPWERRRIRKTKSIETFRRCLLVYLLDRRLERVLALWTEELTPRIVIRLAFQMDLWITIKMIAPRGPKGP